MTLELLLLLLFLLVLKKYFLKTKRQKLLDKFPGPKSYPIVGSMLDFLLCDEDPAIRMRRMPQEYGSVFLIWLGSEPTIILTDPSDVEVVLGNRKITDRSETFRDFRTFVERGLFTSKGEDWKQQRKMLTPAFTSSILQSFLQYFDLHAQQFVEKMSKNVGKDIDIVPLAARYAFDVVIDTAMKHEDVAEKTRVMEAYDEVSAIVGGKATNFIENTFLFPYMKVGKRYYQLIEFCQGVTNSMVKERKTKLKVEKSTNACDEINDRRFRRPFLDLLLELKEEGADLSDSEIRMQVDTFMVAGYDTTQSSVSFALYCLSQYPEIQDKVYDELTDIFGDGDREATYEDLLQMKYLDKVIKETMRLYTTTRFVGRRAEEDIHLKSGYIIPKHCDIMVMVYAMHIDPKLFPEPHVFNPERFDSEDVIPFSFLPFGAGQRDCIGKKFALLSMKSLISQILRTFRLFPSKVPIVSMYGINMKSSSGVHLKVETRKR